MCMRIMQARLAGSLPRGCWMASQAVTASRLAARFAMGNATKAEVAQAAALLRRGRSPLRRRHSCRSCSSCARQRGDAARAARIGRAGGRFGGRAPGPNENGQALAGAQDEQEDETAAAVLAALRDAGLCSEDGKTLAEGTRKSRRRCEGSGRCVHRACPYRKIRQEATRVGWMSRTGKPFTLQAVFEMTRCVSSGRVSFFAGRESRTACAIRGEQVGYWVATTRPLVSPLTIAKRPERLRPCVQPDD